MAHVCHQPTDPTNSFVEIVQIGRNFVHHKDVTLYYNSGHGRGEFTAHGGTISHIERHGRDRRLTIETRSGHKFDITRHRGGGYHLNTGGYWHREERSYH